MTPTTLGPIHSNPTVRVNLERPAVLPEIAAKAAALFPYGHDLTL